jgi:hypothetical protein
MQFNFNKTQIKKFLMSDHFWFFCFLLIIMSYAFYKINHFYDHALRGTKMQVLKVMR